LGEEYRSTYWRLFLYNTCVKVNAKMGLNALEKNDFIPLNPE